MGEEESRAGQVGSLKKRPFQVDFRKIRFFKMSVPQDGLSKIRASEISSFKVSVAKVCSVEKSTR